MLASEAKGRGFDPRLAYHPFLFLISFFWVGLDAADLYLRDARQLADCFALVDFRLDDPLVPPIFNAYMPDGLEELPDADRIALFVRTLLPLVLRENGRIGEERTRLTALPADGALSDADDALFRRTAVKYGALKKDEQDAPIDVQRRAKIIDELLLKVRPVDPALALGLAALESGWGTSRFVREANNLFGHTAVHAWKGIQPLNWSGSERNIKRFETVGDSIARFMLNLNRNRAYLRYRIYRELRPDEPIVQADGFLNYSRLGVDYTARLKRVMQRFDLLRYSAYRLDGESRALGVDHLGTPYLQ